MNQESIQFIGVDVAIAIHDDQIERYGGSPGILSRTGLESAVLSPQATFGGTLLLATLADLAAAYVFYLARSHAFQDGNKRTALAVGMVFLGVNGTDLHLDHPDVWVQMVVDIATGAMSREQLAEVFATEMGDWGEID